MPTHLAPAGHVIFREGDATQDAYRIVRGRIAIRIGLPEGNTLLLAELGSGDIFGEMAMVDEKPRSATATAIEDTELEVMAPQDFNRLILEEPRTLLPYLSCFFERLRMANHRLREELIKRGNIPPTAAAGAIERLRFGTNASSGSAGSVRLIALTGIAEQRIDTPEQQVPKFPFRIGRAPDGGSANVFAANDWRIRDVRPYCVSRNHCAIEREGSQFFVRDRGSSHGTIVNGVPIGIDAGSLIAPLMPGDNVVILGKPDSPYQFQAVVEPL
jgi:CRP-like cAMP-binding protein